MRHSWRDVALFAGSLRCTVDKFEQMRTWLQTLGASISDFACTPAAEGAASDLPSVGCLREAVEAMRARGRAAFRSHLSYQNEGLVDALMMELQHQANSYNEVVLSADAWVDNMPYTVQAVFYAKRAREDQRVHARGRGA